MTILSISSEELRDIIEGKTQYRKCPNCQGTGVEYFKWSSESQEGLTQPVSAQEYYDNEQSEAYGYEECENCNEVGYVVAFRGE